MKVYFNSRDEFYRKPFGAVKTGTEVTFRLRVSEPIRSLKCYIAMWQNDQKLPEIEIRKPDSILDIVAAMQRQV